MARSTTKELTSGSPMKLILGFAVPLLFGMLFQQFYSLMDTIIVGRYLGVTALAAVGATGSICNGFGLPVAQRFGARDYDGVRKYVGNSAILSVLIGGVLTALTVIFCRQILVLMQTPSDIIDLSYNYIVVIFAGIPATILYNTLLLPAFSGGLHHAGHFSDRCGCLKYRTGSVLYHLSALGSFWCRICYRFIAGGFRCAVSFRDHPEI